jgi:hypothetical protein
MNEIFTRNQVEEIILMVKTRFGGSELQDYVSDYEVLDWFNKKYPNDEFDKCVLCSKVSPYTKNTHIDNRIGYVEGAGQGCFTPKQCNKNY